jgi:hypothetical protein
MLFRGRRDQDLTGSLDFSLNTRPSVGLNFDISPTDDAEVGLMTYPNSIDLSIPFNTY